MVICKCYGFCKDLSRIMYIKVPAQILSHGAERLEYTNEYIASMLAKPTASMHILIKGIWRLSKDFTVSSAYKPYRYYSIWWCLVIVWWPLKVFHGQSHSSTRIRWDIKTKQNLFLSTEHSFILKSYVGHLRRGEEGKRPLLGLPSCWPFSSPDTDLYLWQSFGTLELHRTHFEN